MNLVSRYGLYAATFLIGANLVTLLLLGIPGPDDYALGEVIGYSTIAVALVAVVLGMRAAPASSYWQRVFVGTSITLWPSVAFGAYNFVYVTWIDPSFSEKYISYVLDGARASMTNDEYLAYAESLRESALYTDPLFQSVIMFLTVLLMGIAVSLIASFFIKSESSHISPTNSVAAS